MALTPFLGFAALASTALGGGTMTFRDVADPGGKPVRLGDVADLSALPAEFRPRAASLVLIDGQKVRTEQSIEHRALAARVRARMPGLRPWLASSYTGSLRLNGSRPGRAHIVAVTDGDGQIVAGAQVTTRLTAGIFTIERSGTAMQAAKPGERFFVRTPDGVVTAECCEGER